MGIVEKYRQSKNNELSFNVAIRGGTTDKVGNMHLTLRNKLPNNVASNFKFF